MISSTEGGNMSSKKKEPIGVMEPAFVMVELYWTILRNKDEYKEDYKEYENDPDGKFMWFTEKWSMLKPLDPSEDLDPENLYHLDSSKPAPIHFFPDNTPMIPVSSKVISKNSCRLHLDLSLDLRCDKEILKNEIKRIIDKEIDTSFRKNIFGDKNSKTYQDYANMLYIYNKKKEGKEPEEIYTMSIEDDRRFFSKGSVIHYYRTIDKYIKDFPVPIRK